MLITYEYLLPDPDSKFSMALTIGTDFKRFVLSTKDDPYILMHMQRELLEEGYACDNSCIKTDDVRGHVLSCQYTDREKVEELVEEVFMWHRGIMAHREALDKILSESGLIVTRKFSGSEYIKTIIRAADEDISQSTVLIEHASAGHRFWNWHDALADIDRRLKRRFNGQVKRLEVDCLLGQIHAAQRKIESFLPSGSRHAEMQRMLRYGNTSIPQIRKHKI